MWPSVEFAEQTHIGLRATNEDTVGVAPFGMGVDDGIVFMMADGVGASPGGATASRIAVEAMAAALAVAPRQWPAHRRLRSAVEEANLAIYDRALADPRLRHMRTTLTATALVGGEIVVAHVGDCRTYLLRAGRLRRLTRDHRWRWHRHMLTRCLGQQPFVRIDVMHRPVYPGDIICQCSDGLHDLVSDSELALELAAGDATTACAALVERTRTAGADDNVSVQIALLHAGAAAPESPSPRVRQGREA